MVKSMNLYAENCINLNVKFWMEEIEEILKKEKIQEKLHKNIYKKYFIWKNCITNNSIA